MSRCIFVPIHLLLLLIVNNGIVSTSSDSECGQFAVEVCVQNLNDLSPTFAFVESEDRFEPICRAFQESVTCLNALGDRCHIGYSKDVFMYAYSGFKSFTTDICTPGSQYRTESTKYSECHKQGVNEYIRCQAKHMEEVYMIKSQKFPPVEMLRHGCCMKSVSTHCFVSTTTKYCGKEAGDLIQQTSDKLYGPLMGSFCKSFEHDSPACAAASSIALSGLLLLIMIILSLKQTLP